MKVEERQFFCSDSGCRRRDSINGCLFINSSNETTVAKTMKNQTNPKKGEKPVNSVAKTDFFEVNNFMYFPIVGKLCEVEAYEV
ncbi:MAG: hypothetical protein P4L35_06245 [Ignavibacteriaceae bacterium]|nr:hypothetical protein [Ignavibacteriaceae bacterium]